MAFSMLGERYRIRVAYGPDAAGDWLCQITSPFGVITLDTPEDMRAFAEDLDLHQPGCGAVSRYIREVADRCAHKGDT